VESFWRHNVTWKSGCFQAPERGDFSKNSGILQLNVKLSITHTNTERPFSSQGLGKADGATTDRKGHLQS